MKQARSRRHLSHINAPDNHDSRKSVPIPQDVVSPFHCRSHLAVGTQGQKRTLRITKSDFVRVKSEREKKKKSTSFLDPSSSQEKRSH